MVNKIKKTTILKEVVKGLWVGVHEPKEPETVQEKIERRFQKKEIFSKPLIPKEKNES